jgi:CMP/dCMP kinase
VHAQNRKDESYADSQQAVELLRQRFESEKARFARYYGASLGNLRNYDLVIDTSLATPDEIADKVCAMALADQAFKGLPRLFLCPQNLLPTKHVREVSRIGGQWAILNGHKRVALALHLKVNLIPGRLLGQDDEILDYGVTARSMFEQEVVSEQVQHWEKAFGFTFS